MPTPDANHRGRPHVSVVVPTYNDTNALTLCLEALSHQTIGTEAFEVIVVDNGSSVIPDVSILANARLVFEEAPGSYAARNRGIAEATGSVIAFTDADCRPLADWLEHAIEVFDRGPEVDMIGGSVEVFPEDPADPTPVELYEAMHGFPQANYIETRGFAVTANLIVRRSVIESVGRFDATLRSGGDVEFGTRAVAAGHRLVFRPEVCVRHPARRTFREYRNKLRRTIAGAADIAALEGRPYPFSVHSTLREVLPPVPTCLAALRDVDRGPWRDRVKLAYAILVIHYVRVSVKVTTRFRRRSPR